MFHVVDMHGRPQSIALRSRSFFEDSFALFLGVAKSNECSNWEDEQHTEPRKQLGFEEKRAADCTRVAKFWTDLGFVRLNESDFYTYAPSLIDQPSPASDIAPSPVVSRVPRGRRRRQSR